MLDYELTLPSLGWLVGGMAFLGLLCSIWANAWRVVFKRSEGLEGQEEETWWEKTSDLWGLVWLAGPIGFFFLLGKVWIHTQRASLGGTGDADVTERGIPWQKLRDSWPSVLLLFLVLAIPGWGFYLFFLVGQGFVFQGYILGGTLLALIFFQLPRLRPPAVYVFVRGSEDGESPTTGVLKELALRRGTQKLFFFFVGNTGINVYEGCETWISFPPNCLTPVRDDRVYQKVDFRKVPEVQKANNAAHYRGSTISPGSVLALPVWVRAEGQGQSGQLRVEFTCCSRWGSAVKSFHAHVHD